MQVGFGLVDHGLYQFKTLLRGKIIFHIVKTEPAQSSHTGSLMINSIVLKNIEQFAYPSLDQYYLQV